MPAGCFGLVGQRRILTPDVLCEFQGNPSSVQRGLFYDFCSCSFETLLSFYRIVSEVSNAPMALPLRLSIILELLFSRPFDDTLALRYS